MSDRPRDIDIDELLGHAAFVRRLARSLVFDEHEADDLSQETWLAALHKPPHLRFGLRGWLRGVVRKLAAQGERRSTRRSRREAAAAAPERLPPSDELVERVEIMERLV